MISVGDGQTRILAQITTVTPPEWLPVGRALERVLAGDLRAPFDVPPTDNSAVDGYAVLSSDLPAEGRRSLAVIADLPAGSVFDRPVRSGQTVRIMTGAPMPPGLDTVVPQEDVERAGSEARIPPIAKGTNVRLRGEDVRAGDIVLQAGSLLRPQEMGLITSLGFPQVAVRRKPRVAILSTGDEV
ncbi:MAG: molybdopterin molybdotransferase MoeA, partial [candidate division NC10 bacterium]